MEQEPILNNIYKEIKIVLVGDGGVGKTSFIKRFLTGEFETKYIATQGAVISSAVINTSKGLI
jgi:GTP-binding nuclear protein Ran